MHISSTITEWHTIMHVIQIELELDLKLKVVVWILELSLLDVKYIWK